MAGKQQGEEVGTAERAAREGREAQVARAGGAQAQVPAGQQQHCPRLRHADHARAIPGRGRSGLGRGGRCARARPRRSRRRRNLRQRAFNGCGGRTTWSCDGIGSCAKPVAFRGGRQHGRRGAAKLCRGAENWVQAEHRGADSGAGERGQEMPLCGSVGSLGGGLELELSQAVRDGGGPGARNHHQRTLAARACLRTCVPVPCARGIRHRCRRMKSIQPERKLAGLSK